MAKDWADMSIQEKEEYLKEQKEEEAKKAEVDKVLRYNAEKEEKTKRTKMILIVLAVFIVVGLVIAFIVCNWDFLKESFMEGYRGEFINLLS